MRKKHFSVLCKGCGKKTSTTKAEMRDKFLCTECRKSDEKVAEELKREVQENEQRKPSLFKRISDWAIRNFGSS